MFSGQSRKNRLTYLLGLVALIALFPSGRGSAALSQDQPAYIRLVRAIKTEAFGVPHPTGLAFAPVTNAFLVLAAQGSAQPVDDAANLVMLSPVADLVGSMSLATVSADPLNMAFDSKANRLLLFDATTNQLSAIKAGPAGLLDRAVITRFETREFGVRPPRGMTVDPLSGHLFILDGAGPQIVRITPNAQGSFEGAAALRDGRIARVDLKQTGLVNPQSIAFNPANGHLYTLSRAQHTLYELTETGQVVMTRDLISPDFKLVDPQGMVFAPSGDQTDDPATLSLYIADSRQGDPWQRPGRIVELALTQPEQLDLAASTIQPTWVQTIDTSAWSTPSPDPMDITYLAPANRLLVSDSEVEEAPQVYWHGVNLFEVSLSGSLGNTHTTYTASPTSLSPNNFSSEPAGVAYNPLNGHWLFSDDDVYKVFDVDPGADGTYGTADDVVTSFATKPCGDNDPESITVDTQRGHLLLADGLDSEVYDISPGPNGRFDGCAAPGDDQATHFDTAALGISDPEAVEFNPDTGHLYITGHHARTVVEATITGSLVTVFDISALNAVNPSGLAYAPSSVNPAVKGLYISARGADNDSNPNENDGKVYEISFTPASSTDLIFADGFESGSLVFWSSSKTDSGDLSVNAAAALVGSKGLQAVIDDTNTIYVTDDRPTAEPRYRARFYFDPNSITMASGNAHYIFYGYINVSGSFTGVLRVEFRFSSGAYQIRTALLNDSGIWTSSSWFTISDAPHSIELDWRAATAAGANNGGLTFWIDGAQKADLTGIDNDTRRIDRVRLGAASGIDSGTLGTYYFDAFESRRQSYIGP